ncbi:hypothetical protein [Brachyspira murdochii]|uniref:hypothetical protein n=1 Tax=Brachyspira murdochii TaxID=84378 RepID=UPI00300701FD
MGLKVYNIDFLELSREKTFRFDFNFISFQNNYSIIEYYSFDDLFDIVINDKVDLKTIFEEDFYYVEISNVSKESDVFPIKLNFYNRTYELENYYKKIEKGDIINVSKNDILISKVRPNLKKYILIDEIYDKYYYTSAFIHIRPKVLNKIFFYLFKTSLYKNLISISRQGKSYPTLKESDFHYLKFSKKYIDILINNESYILDLIEPIENKIKSLKESIIPEQKIINEVFARKFEFDDNLYNEFGKGMTAGTQIADNRTFKVFNTDFADFSKSDIMRFSTRFHNTPTKKLMNILNDIDTIKVKNIIFEYEKGIQPNYNTEGEIHVVKIQNLKNSYIDFNDSEYILEEEYNLISDSKKLKYDDIILCVTGKISLGKIDLYNYEEDAITTVDNFIIRIINYNKLFFVYFFRSILGYFQMERDFTGTTNQIHLRWKEIENFKIPNIPLEKQQEMVDEIDNKIKEQQKINIQIEKERNKIYDIINSYINE